MSAKSWIVVFLALGVGLWAAVNLLLSGGLFAERIQHLVITPLRTHLGPEVTVSTVQLTVVPTRLTLKDVTIPPFGASMDVLNASVRVDEITMKFSPWSLLTETLILQTMTIKGVHASLRNTQEHRGPSAPLSVPFLLSQYWPREIVLRNVVFSDLNIELGTHTNKTANDQWKMTGIEGQLRSDFAMKNFHLDITTGTAEIQSADIAKAPMRFVSIEATMVLHPRHLEIKEFSVGGTIGHIALHGRIDDPEVPTLTLHADVRSTVEDLRVLQIVNNIPVSMEDLHGVVHLKGEIVGTWPDVRTRGMFSVGNLRVGETALGHSRGRYSLDQGHLTVKALSTDLFGGRLHGNINMQWQIEKPMHTQLVLGYEGLAGTLQLSGSLEDAVLDLSIEGSTRDVGEIARLVNYTEPLAGQLDFKGSITGEIPEPEIRGRAAIKDLMVKGRFIDSAWATLAYQRGRLDIAKAILRQGAGLFDIEGLVLFPDGEGAPSADFTVMAQNGSLRDVVALVYKELPIPEQANGTMIVHVDGAQNYVVKGSLSFPAGQALGERFDEGDVEFVLNPRGATFTRLQLRQGRGAFEGKGWIGFDGTFRGSIRGLGIDAQKVNWIKTHAPGLAGKANIHLVGSGSIDRPIIHGSARFHQLRYDRLLFGNGQAEIQTRDSASTLVASFDRGVEVNAEVGWEGEKPFTASAEFSNFDASPFVNQLISPAHTLSWTSTGALAVEGNLDRWNDAVVVGRFPTVHTGINGHQLQNEKPVEGMFREGVLAIDHLRLVGENTSAELTGHVVPFERYDLILAGNVNPQLAQILMDDITVKQGVGTLDVKISKHWDTPEVTGTYQVRDLLLHSRFSEQPIFISAMDVQIDSGTVNIQSFTGRYGKGLVRGNGSANVAKWMLDDFLVNAKISDVQYSTEPGLVATVQGDVRFEGKNTLQKITGNLTVIRIKSGAQRTVKDFLVNDVKPLLASRRQSRSGHAVEIDIHATGTQGLRLENPLARLPLDMDLLVKGTLEQPEFLGRVGSRGGSVFIGKRQFDVLDAGIDFVAHQDHRALYTVHAKSQLRLYDVDLFLSGIDDQVNISLTSDPPLEEAVILAYLDEGGNTRDRLFARKHRSGHRDSAVTSLASEGAARTLFSHRIEVEKRVLADRLYALLATPAVLADEQLIRLKYPVSDNLSLVGERNEEGRVVGDLRYRIEFP